MQEDLELALSDQYASMKAEAERAANEQDWPMARQMRSKVVELYPDLLDGHMGFADACFKWGGARFSEAG